MNSSPTPPTEKVCRKCGLAQPLARFPFRKAEQTYRNTCKACRAAESYALRHHPEHGPIIRERERQRNHQRRPYILKWQREHPEQMRPGQQRRWARRKDKLRRATYRPLLGPFRAVPPPPAIPNTPKGGRGSKSLGTPSPTP